MVFSIWVTTRCNLYCDYCYEGKNKADLDMNAETADKVLDFISGKIKQDGVNEKIKIVFHGGEPLLNISIIKYIMENITKFHSKSEVFYSITTNGVLISESNIDFLVNSFNEISISIDGTAQTHDLHRKNASGKGSYNKVINNAKSLLQKRNDIRVRMTITPNNVENLFEGVCHLFDMGFINVIPAPALEIKEWSSSGIEVLKSQLLKIKTLVRELNMDEDKYFCAMIDKREFRKKGLCSGGVSSFHIYPDGNIYPCVYVAGRADSMIGNIIDGINMVSVESLAENNKRSNELCKGCTMEAYCMASRCKLINYALTGYYVEPLPFLCAVERLKYQIYNVV